MYGANLSVLISTDWSLWFQRSSTSQLHSSTGDDDRNPEATFLHLAASIADVPLAYENIRLGTYVDSHDDIHHFIEH